MLYITINRQEEQRTEDRLADLIERRSNRIRELIAELSIDVNYNQDHEIPDDEILNEVPGKYSGAAALSMANIMVDSSFQGLDLYKIHHIQWSQFLLKINTAITEATWALEQNANAKVVWHIRKQHYEYVLTVLMQIQDFYDELELYYQKYPEDPAYQRFAIKLTLGFASQLRQLKKFDPGEFN